MKFRNPFKKHVSPAQQMISDMKSAAIGNMQNQMYEILMGVFSGIGEYHEKKKYRIIMQGKAVEEVHANPDVEEKEQDAIYSEFMAMMNGDRDVKYDIPDEIDIKAFDNDSMTEEERNEIYDIIDTINEANDIKREGKFRTEESVRKEEEESRKKAMEETANQTNSNIKEMIFDAIRPMMGLVFMMFSTVFTLILVSKMTVLIDKI